MIIFGPLDSRSIAVLPALLEVRATSRYTNRELTTVNTITTKTNHTKMKFTLSLAILALAVISSAAAYAVTGGSVYMNKEMLFKIDPSSKDSHRVTLDSVKDAVTISVAVEGKKEPHQCMFLLSDNNGLDHAVFALFRDGQALAEISVNKLPSALKKSERIFVSFIAADAREDEVNVNFPFVEFLPSETLKLSVTSESPLRLGAQPEIHHIFNTEAPTVHGIVPVFFSALAVALFVALIGAWSKFIGIKLFASFHGSTWKAALLATLVSFEYTFFKYYLGTSIFTTAFRTMILAAPFLFFSSRALTSLGKAREHGAA